MKIKLDFGAYAPTRSHTTDAGLDLYSPVDVLVPERGSVTIDTGVHVELPDNSVGMIKSRSGLNVNLSITSEGVIDVGYTGSIRVKLYNHSDDPYVVRRGHKITQLVVLPCLFPEVEVVESLEETDRGDNGFGSTGR